MRDAEYFGKITNSMITYKGKFYDVRAVFEYASKLNKNVSELSLGELKKFEIHKERIVESVSQEFREK